MLHKGQKVAVEDRLRFESWEKDGQKRSKVSVTADNIEFMSAKTDSKEPSEDIPW